MTLTMTHRFVNSQQPIFETMSSARRLPRKGPCPRILNCFLSRSRKVVGKVFGEVSILKQDGFTCFVNCVAIMSRRACRRNAPPPKCATAEIHRVSRDGTCRDRSRRWAWPLHKSARHSARRHGKYNGARGKLQSRARNTTTTSCSALSGLFATRPSARGRMNIHACRFTSLPCISCRFTSAARDPCGAGPLRRGARASRCARPHLRIFCTRPVL